ncbi:MAG: hypothetical protein NVS3B10_10530 [Polyangiales bacterium]
MSERPECGVVKPRIREEPQAADAEHVRRMTDVNDRRSRDARRPGALEGSQGVAIAPLSERARRAPVIEPSLERFALDERAGAEEGRAANEEAPPADPRSSCHALPSIAHGSLR